MSAATSKAALVLATVVAVASLFAAGSSIQRAYAPFPATVVSSNAGSALVEKPDGGRLVAMDPYGDLADGEAVTVERGTTESVGGKPVRSAYYVAGRGGQ